MPGQTIPPRFGSQAYDQAITDMTTRDPREGFFGRRFRTGDIELDPEPQYPAPPPKAINAGYQPQPLPANINLPEPLRAGETIVPAGIPGQPNVRGTASFNGQSLNTEALLAGLKNANSISNAANYGHGIPLEEMYQRAALPEFDYNARGEMIGGRAPGASSYWRQQIQDRLRTDQMNQDAQRKNVIDTEAALQGLHPAIQGAAEQEAQRRSYPAIYAAQGQVGAAQAAGEAGLAQQQAQNVATLRKSYNDLLAATESARARGFGMELSDEDQAFLRQLQQIMDGLTQSQARRAR